MYVYVTYVNFICGLLLVLRINTGPPIITSATSIQDGRAGCNGVRYFGKLLQKASLSLAWQHGESLALKHTNKRHMRKQKPKEKLAAEDNLWDFFLTEVMMNLKLP